MEWSCLPRLRSSVYFNAISVRSELARSPPTECGSPYCRDRAAMTGNAEQRVLRARARSVEARPVRTESEPTANGGVTRGAIAFGVTGHARLETLSRCLPVTQAETSKRVVIPALSNARSSYEPGLPVTTLAELRRVMAIATVCFSPIRGARVSR